MIELKSDRLIFTFPDVHPEARLEIEFQRTLRIPDDGMDYPLPPGLGRFPLRHVDDFAKNVPPAWLEHGGVMMPMYQSEAMWLFFHSSYIDDRDTEYPFAIKVAAGKIDAVTGGEWTNDLHGIPQDYMVSPRQPWLDGYCVEKGIIRQFVAMPVGAGYSAEEQITGKGEFGGLQIIVYPMKREIFERRFPLVPKRRRYYMKDVDFCVEKIPMTKPDMGLAPGGRMKQEIYEDPYDFTDWDQEHGSRCFTHISNSLVWRAITGQSPPTVPPTAAEYDRAGLPWFDYYAADATALEGSDALKKLKSVIQLAEEKKDAPLPENESVKPERVIHLRKGLKKGQVREGRF
jgi:hypothetical protein